MHIKIAAINISEKKGTQKYGVNKARINNLGIIGDAHAGNWHRQISLLGQESILQFSQKNHRPIKPGEFGENIILEGMDFSLIQIADRFKINVVILEVTQIGKTCHGTGCPIYQAAGDCIMPREGVFTRIVQQGIIKTGDPVTFIPHQE